jgi:single-strand DNA-binding protein
MPTFNQCQFIGRLGKDPVLEVTANGKPHTKFSLAVDQGKDQPTMWLNVTTWDKLAENVEKYARKGMQVFLQGKLQIRTYKDKQHNIDRLSVEIIASVVQLLEKKPKEEGDLPDEVLPEA